MAKSALKFILARLQATNTPVCQIILFHIGKKKATTEEFYLALTENARTTQNWKFSRAVTKRHSNIVGPQQRPSMWSV